jgi:hypothetical protein
MKIKATRVHPATMFFVMAATPVGRDRAARERRCPAGEIRKY